MVSGHDGGRGTSDGGGGTIPSSSSAPPLARHSHWRQWPNTPRANERTAAGRLQKPPSANRPCSATGRCVVSGHTHPQQSDTQAREVRGCVAPSVNRPPAIRASVSGRVWEGGEEGRGRGWHTGSSGSGQGRRPLHVCKLGRGNAPVPAGAKGTGVQVDRDT